VGQDPSAWSAGLSWKRVMRVASRGGVSARVSPDAALCCLCNSSSNTPNSDRWEARVGVPGSNHIYLGLWEKEEDAAKAYDRAIVRLRGPSATTNFALSFYRLVAMPTNVVEPAIVRCTIWGSNHTCPQL
jgi:hypothetical protein